MTITRQHLTLAGAATVALAAAALAAANFAGDGENGGVGPYAVTLAASVVLAGILFGWAIPRTERPARAGLVAAAFALLSLPLYWSGLPFVLGPAAAVYGLVAGGRSSQGRAGAATTAVLLGTLATVAAIAALTWDAMS